MQRRVLPCSGPLVSPRRKQEAAWVWPRSLRSVLLLHFCTFWKCFKVICLHYSFGTKTGNNQPTPLERKGMNRAYLNTLLNSEIPSPILRDQWMCVLRTAWTAGMERWQERLKQTANEWDSSLSSCVPRCSEQLQQEHNPTHQQGGTSSFKAAILFLPPFPRTPGTYSR